MKNRNLASKTADAQVSNKPHPKSSALKILPQCKHRRVLTAVEAIYRIESIEGEGKLIGQIVIAWQETSE